MYIPYQVYKEYSKRHVLYFPYQNMPYKLEDPAIYSSANILQMLEDLDQQS